MHSLYPLHVHNHELPFTKSTSSEIDELLFIDLLVLSSAADALSAMAVKTKSIAQRAISLIVAAECIDSFNRFGGFRFFKLQFIS